MQALQQPPSFHSPVKFVGLFTCALLQKPSTNSYTTGSTARCIRVRTRLLEKYSHVRRPEHETLLLVQKLTSVLQHSMNPSRLDFRFSPGAQKRLCCSASSPALQSQQKGTTECRYQILLFLPHSASVSPLEPHSSCPKTLQP